MRKLSLGSRLVIGGVIVVVVPLIVIGVFSIRKATNALTAVSKEQVGGIADKLAQMCQVAVLNELKFVKTLALERATAEALSNPVKSQGNDGVDSMKKMTRHLGQVIKSVGSDYESICLVNSEGLTVADGSNGEYEGLSVSDRDYFKTAKEGKPNIGAVAKSKKTGNPIVPVVAPVLGEKGEFLGVVSALLKIDYLIQEIAGTKTGKTGYAFMADNTGRIIAHPRKELILELNIASLKGMEKVSSQMIAQKAGVEEYLFEGIRKIAGYAPVGLTGWSVVLTQPVDEFLEGAYAIRNGTIMVAAIFLVLTIGVVLLFARQITRPVMRVVDGLASGADQVAAASSQVSSSSQSLAEGASEQAASLEETSSSLEEMASMTKQNADHANEANTLMMEIRRVVDGSNSAMRDLTASMTEISRSSEETSKIIKTIDEIAFQTNLLALNAAVEAARAGEAGAGFAVVADEVRNLAIRAAEAAKNTASLIEGTVKRIKDGTELVNKTGSAFQLVSTSTEKMGELVGEIAAASNEQAQGIDQINKAVSEMDSVVQQNAASAEESASASEELNAQAEQMKGYVKDLVAVIGGHKEQEKGKGGRRSKAASEAANGHKVVSGAQATGRMGNGKGFIRPEGLAGSSPQLKGGVKRSFPQSAQVSPNQILPLDAEDFDNF